MFAIRERSVVRSSVIASAKYCWSGSLLRLANGSTTIDRRGARRVSLGPGRCQFEAVTAAARRQSAPPTSTKLPHQSHLSSRGRAKGDVFPDWLGADGFRDSGRSAIGLPAPLPDDPPAASR